VTQNTIQSHYENCVNTFITLDGTIQDAEKSLRKLCPSELFTPAGSYMYDGDTNALRITNPITVH
jgi:hypothetical protein